MAREPVPVRERIRTYVGPRPGFPRPRSRSRRRWIIAGVIFAAVAVVGFVIGVAIVLRLQTGEWQVPEPGDVVRVMIGERRGPSKTIFLERNPIVLEPGIDDAAAGKSSVVASAHKTSARVPGWKGSAAGWAKVVACVRELFAPFDVTVTDARPPHDDFVLVAVGGKPTDIGVKTRHVGGLAPFNGEVIPRPVVFAFAGALRHDVRQICETIGMEVAHTYGLDHAYECKDVMTYLPRCGAKRFVDKDVPCGERKRRACEGGAATQNSYRELARVLGMRRR